jgi:hypothetical protein
MDAPRDRVAAMIREILRSAEVTDLIDPDDPAPGHAEFDMDPRFYTPLSVVRAIAPFCPELPGLPGLREAVLDGIRDIRGLMQRKDLAGVDCRAYMPTPEEARGAVVYFRIAPFVFTALAVPGPGEAGDQADSIWDLSITINVDDEAVG